MGPLPTAKGWRRHGPGTVPGQAVPAEQPQPVHGSTSWLAGGQQLQKNGGLVLNQWGKLYMVAEGWLSRRWQSPAVPCPPGCRPIGSPSS